MAPSTTLGYPFSRCASSTGSLIGSAEYAISHLKTKLLCVTGHTKCGAVTAAVQTVLAHKEKLGEEELTDAEVSIGFHPEILNPHNGIR